MGCVMDRAVGRPPRRDRSPVLRHGRAAAHARVRDDRGTAGGGLGEEPPVRELEPPRPVLREEILAGEAPRACPIVAPPLASRRLLVDDRRRRRGPPRRGGARRANYTDAAGLGPRHGTVPRISTTSPTRARSPTGSGMTARGAGGAARSEDRRSATSTSPRSTTASRSPRSSSTRRSASAPRARAARSRPTDAATSAGTSSSIREGGSSGCGHPLGATGIAQAVEVYQQFAQEVPAVRQVPGPGVGIRPQPLGERERPLGDGLPGRRRVVSAAAKSRRSRAGGRSTGPEPRPTPADRGSDRALPRQAPRSCSTSSRSRAPTRPASPGSSTAFAKDGSRTTRCPKDGDWHWPPRTACPKCHSEELEWADLPERGRIYAFSAVLGGAPLGMEDDVPFAVGLVDLDGAPLRLFGRIEGQPWPELHVGDPVRVEIVSSVGDGRVFYRFRTVSRPASRPGPFALGTRRFLTAGVVATGSLFIPAPGLARRRFGESREDGVVAIGMVAPSRVDGRDPAERVRDGVRRPDDLDLPASSSSSVRCSATREGRTRPTTRAS